MKAKKFFMGILVVTALLMLEITYAQEPQNLKFIYADWQLSTKSTDSTLIFHSKKHNTLDKSGSRDLISFEKSENGFISTLKYSNYPGCGMPLNSYNLAAEKWVIVSQTFK